ncbi:low molecular weight phosphotyrosine protein phosphatase, putative [Trichomonas vaginalis G3]|uniref:Low molecular weight phosphotyrosine protein phosphatase, putative n=1 Tax=Trichomonas vaginalis (strain ATCC PRA-98 / G3) TaxID=412133 RepID=A2DYL9_TRIV3|nr:non-membrane spanning protein tyrosine phosphatase protein [Trichomonas vaginalis G3]EAY14554.1 low molecular weight phosphotyrosine protein phosphatase, putative [Trichomonas vaginalis G3]KAI5529278.1 non-membrane spanning protein tyrosine phosphatase protein [Trichomonas vaginalis G3]|eukprot:XP_001326777.1 low molecular weight phosphotyrosine protein phosphatase [Trichomonas vaginalis G3]
MQKKSILFVCTGNIIRSPVCQGICDKITGGALRVDSAATSGLHRNETADDRAVRIVKKHGIDISQHRARTIRLDDWILFDYIVAIDKKVYNTLLKIKSEDSKAKLMLYSSEGIPDPYF